MSGPTPPWLRSLIIQYLGILNSLAHLGPAVQDFFPKRRNAPIHCDIHFRPWKNQLRLQQTQRRCGEMADATDLKSVPVNRGVWVRIPSSAPSEKRFCEGKSSKTVDSIDCAASRNKTHEMTAYLPSIRQVRPEHEARFTAKERP